MKINYKNYIESMSFFVENQTSFHEINFTEKGYYFNEKTK